MNWLPQGPTAARQGPSRTRRQEELALALLFCRLVWKGYRKLLEPKDLWSLGKENSSEELVSRLEREWTRNRRTAQW